MIFELLNRIEKARTISIRTKRDRVLSRLSLAINITKRTSRTSPDGDTEILSKTSSDISGRVYPLHGVPDAVWIHDIEEISTSRHGSEKIENAIAYNGLGVHDRWVKHLTWLNGKKCLTTLSHDALDDWVGGLD